MHSSPEIIHVLIADDHAVYRNTVKTMLSGKPDIVFRGEASNGQELLSLIPGFIPHVILLDVQMPVMDGLATLPQIREQYPDISVIMLSLHNDHCMISRLMELGANAYLPKTTDIEIIYETILACCEHSGKA